MLTVDLAVHCGNTRLYASMDYEPGLDYTLMKINRVEQLSE
jgi:hypothetical protein